MADDYYAVLGVPRTAGAAEIQQAFRTLARRYHPDVNRDPAAEERFKQINEAYSVLSDPDTRSRYDRFGPDFRQIPKDYDERVAAGQGFGGGAGAYRGSPFGGTRGADRAGARTWTETGFDASGVDFEDLFGGMFGGRAGGAGRGSPIPGADQEAELTLSVEEAYRGGRRKITLGGPGGERSYDVTIPAGVVDGQRIRLAGEGGRGRGPGSAGDLYLVVRIAPHPRYRLVGRDIHVELPVTAWEAALGATVPVSGPGGTVKVHVPPGTSTGRRLRLRSEGMPDPKGSPGHLYAEIQVMVPPSPSPRERELFEELAAVSSFDPRKQT
ncbi:DnaJ C-terminal domain-containing protein [Streptomyces sp. CB01881]|uniref:DnaJ C-terminal domain-containing protein n=1 Tax=Streptomyces sp. CB01881 TaxID=2078691 RepID=UPI000CDC7E38|nr:DnaJ C-terminal domain-containing protein [Streptomyces sp. CB01881]AUY48357.1 molecular chaperone DnaJ [Streptomyces sp. CB01881]TYC76845.1 J domain-containing protein [Streptomyces sp. CB01881]